MLGSELGLGERGVLEPQGRVCVCTGWGPVSASPGQDRQMSGHLGTPSRAALFQRPESFRREAGVGGAQGEDV